MSFKETSSIRLSSLLELYGAMKWHVKNFEEEFSSIYITKDVEKVITN